MTTAFLRMMRALVAGRYRPIPWRSIVLLMVLLVYLFSPLDLIPDYIPFFGVVDDIALLAFFLRSLGKDVSSFREWERAQTK